MINDIERSIEIGAPIEHVWQVMTSDGMVDQWLGCLGYRAEIGHVFYMQPDPAKRAQGNMSGATHCELLRLDPPSLMVFSWYFPETPSTHVSIRLSPIGNRTWVELVHGGWDQFDEAQIGAIRDALDGGWRSFVLPQLKQVAEAAAD